MRAHSPERWRRSAGLLHEQGRRLQRGSAEDRERQLDLTCAGAGELALALLSEADRACLVGRVGAGPAIGALN